MNPQSIILAAGCFWGVEQILSQTQGVLSTEVGYIGGHTENPTYKQVCQSNTGHAEAVKVKFDPSVISFKELLNVFFRFHDPTTLNRQGPDIGSQYRSAIFYTTEEQEEQANEIIQQLEENQVFEKQIVTEVVSAQKFWPAEEYHQKYFEKNPSQGCHFLKSW